MSDELKNCPFCPESVLVGHRYEDEEIVACTVCGARAEVSVWNHRPIEDALRTKLEGAEARCKSALNLYEEYHDTNIELRADLAAAKDQVEQLEAITRWLVGAIRSRLDCDCPAGLYGDEACQPDRDHNAPCLRNGVFCWLDFAHKKSMQQGESPQ